MRGPTTIDVHGQPGIGGDWVGGNCSIPDDIAQKNSSLQLS